ncbi:ATP-grasp domain-containing protein [Maribacter forsetii]|uniref:ATP-grasp domain-containing protein n=1 Tax=Maribacter forsetii TaxID=444515 RepID=UPI000569AFE8|nr:ATP-grasp domain-containing protein [Maribacter forsetii]
MTNKIAILYQAKLPPIKNGIQKPMKPGGYSDSGADIAYELKKNGIHIITPIENPDNNIDLDWVFPDTKEGIEHAISKGADTFWLNTVLYKKHEIEHFFDKKLQFIGQLPEKVDIYDKYFTNELLRKNQIPVPKSELITSKDLTEYKLSLNFPLVVKPIRGRGSQGVTLVKNQKELDNSLRNIFSDKEYGDIVLLEQYLNGQEITITVMPSGTYVINHNETKLETPWCLPAVKRFNHKDGIAPYNGNIAVINNSLVLNDAELKSKEILEVYSHCQKAGELLQINAPIRIDCRADENGKYYLFDLNMKPNMTGPSRPQRQNQDSLTLLSARKIGWNYFELLKNMIRQSWIV